MTDVHSPTDDSTPEDQPIAPAWKQKLLTPKGKFVVGVVAIIVLFALVTAQVYARPVTDNFVRTMSGVVPYPAISVDGKTVTIKEFLIEYDALQQYFGDLGEQAPPSGQLEIAIADTLVNKIAIQKLASAYGVKLDEERVEQYYQDVIAQDGEEAFAENLVQTFGWTPEEFKTRIVESIVLALQMTDAVLADTQVQQSRLDLIDSAYARVQAAEDFATIAKDVHAGFEGIESDLGYVKVSVIPESWASQVTALEEGQTTAVIDLPEGYAIFKLEEKIIAGEDTQMHLLSITVPKVSLEEVVEEYLATVKVKRYVGVE
ncbi:MAG TPA: peptidyl-prolyl cis-trans isomerase [Patescibacteria group bacterium]|nr:peptidyl-prolyl cis-trans isomerase [Patescibacteria group bacterium]